MYPKFDISDEDIIKTLYYHNYYYTERGKDYYNKRGKDYYNAEGYPIIIKEEKKEEPKRLINRRFHF